MAVMMGSLCDALIKAGADGDSARKAAEEVANFDLRVNGLETRIDRLDSRMEARFATLTWMVGVVLTFLILVLGGLLGLLWKVFPVGGGMS